MSIKNRGLLPDNTGNRKAKVEFKTDNVVLNFSRTYMLAVKDETDQSILSEAIRLFKKHPDYDTAVLKSLEVRQDSEELDGGYFAWLAVCEYTTDEELSDGGDNPPTYPGNEADISYSFEKIDLPITKDRDGKPFLNTANDPFDPTYVLEVPIGVKTISVNLDEMYYDLNQFMLDYIYAVNLETYDGWAPGKAKVLDITGKPGKWVDIETNRVVKYMRTQIKIGFNYLGWQPELLSQGYNELYDIGGGNMRPRAILLPGSGKEYGGKAPLDIDGKALFNADALDTNKLVYMKFNVFREVSFRGLRFN